MYDLVQMRRIKIQLSIHLCALYKKEVSLTADIMHFRANRYSYHSVRSYCLIYHNLKLKYMFTLC